MTNRKNDRTESIFTEMNYISTLVNTDSLRTAEPFKNLFPIREDTLDKIAESMKRYGFDRAHPIAVWSGHNLTVVDGHTRLLAAIKLGFPQVPVVLKKFANEDEALKYAIGSQRNRRNLTDAELMKCISALDQRRKAGRPRKGEAISGKSAEQTATLLGTSRGTVEKIRSIIDHAPEEIKNAIRSGNLTINKAYVITMEKRKIGKYRDEDERRAALAEELQKGLIKIVRDIIVELKKKYPGILLTGEQAAEVFKVACATIKTELDKLTMEGND